MTKSAAQRSKDFFFISPPRPKQTTTAESTYKFRLNFSFYHLEKEKHDGPDFHQLDCLDFD